MIDFKLTFPADELLDGYYEKMSVISESMFRKFLRQFDTKTVLPPKQSVNPPYCEGNVSAIMDCAF